LPLATISRRRRSSSGVHYRNNDNVAGGLMRHPVKPQIGQGIAEHAVPAGRQHDGQRFAVAAYIMLAGSYRRL
jgi:hypothetical protein